MALPGAAVLRRLFRAVLRVLDLFCPVGRPGCFVRYQLLVFAASHPVFLAVLLAAICRGAADVAVAQAGGAYGRTGHCGARCAEFFQQASQMVDQVGQYPGGGRWHGGIKKAPPPISASFYARVSEP